MKLKLLLFPIAGLLLYILLSGYGSGPGFAGGTDGTGASGSTTGCASCHGYTASTTTAITLELLSGTTPVTTYTAGSSYTIRITGTNTSADSLPKFGFQLGVVRNLTTTNAGILSAIPGTHAVTASGINLIEHSSALSCSSGTGGVGSTYVVSIPWTAPVAGTGAVKLCAVLNAVNADGIDNTYDKWNNASLVIPESFTGIAPISGTFSFCLGTTTTLTDATPSGTWSSSLPSVATVGSTTGIVTGISAGNAIITYFVGSTFVTAGVTVYPVPNLITGSLTLCPGGTSAFSNTIPGGTWSSSNNAVATIGTLSGMASGIAAGTANITYAFGGCYTIKAITVNPLPDAGAITHTTVLAFCTGVKMQLGETMTGGVWSIANSHATLTGDTLTAVSPGTDTVYYTVTNGCGTTIASFIVDVPAPPPPLTGNLWICVGDTTILKDSIKSGMWYGSGPISLYTPFVDSAVVVGRSQGLAVITYSMDLGCSTAAVITINPLPPIGRITGLDTACINSVFMLTDSIGGGRWTVHPQGIISVDSITGRVTTLSTGTATITYNTVPNNYGCTSTANFKVTIIPGTDFTVSSSIATPNCFGATGSIAVNINGKNGRYSYLWNTSDTVNTLPAVAAGTYSLITEETLTKCIDTSTFTIGQPDSLHLVVDKTKDICRTNSGSLSATIAGGTAPYQYLWSNKATAGEITGLPAGPYTLWVTDINGCIKEMSTIVEDSACSDIVIHDGISPNGDGINDTWVIDGIRQYPASTVQLFDKWGDLVFERAPYKNDWSGIGNNGSLLPDGTYFYLVNLNSPNPPNGNVVYKGALLLKR